jgi:hypothetical protein
MRPPDLEYVQWLERMLRYVRVYLAYHAALDELELGRIRFLETQLKLAWDDMPKDQQEKATAIVEGRMD